MMIWWRQWLLITQYAEISLHPHAVKYTTWYVGSIKCHHLSDINIWQQHGPDYDLICCKINQLKTNLNKKKKFFVVVVVEGGESTRKKWKRKDIPRSQMNSKKFRNTRCHLNKIKIESYTTYLSAFRHWRHS